MAVGLTAWLLHRLASLALIKSFSMDELSYLHAGWMTAHGFKPYADFYLNFIGIGQIAAIPCLFVGSNIHAVLAMRLFHLLMIGLLGLAAWRMNRSAGPLAGPLSIAVMFTMWTFGQYMIEVRPDSVALAFFAASMAVLFEDKWSTEARSCASGALYAIASWMTPKGMICGLAFAAVLAIDAVIKRRRYSEYVIHPAGFFIGGFAVAAIVTIYLLANGIFSDLWTMTLPNAEAHERLFTHYAWRRVFHRFFEGRKFIFRFAAIGVAEILWQTWKERRIGPEMVLALSIVSAFLSYRLQHGALSYSWLPLAGVLCVLAVRGVFTIARLLRLLDSRVPYSGLFLSGAFLAAFFFYTVGRCESNILRLERRTNRYQLKVIAKICELTLPSDMLYDNTGQFVVRPNATQYYLMDRVMKRTRRQNLIGEVPGEIINAECKGWMYDRRTGDLPHQLKQFLHSHFVVYRDDIYLWGTRFGAGAPKVQNSFLAVESDQYFIDPPSAEQEDKISIDGQPVRDQIFYLKKGPHEVTYERGHQTFFLLWLPRDGRPYSPKFRSHPHFFRYTFPLF